MLRGWTNLQILQAFGGLSSSCKASQKYILFKKYSVENCLSAGMDFVNGIFLFISIVTLPKWPVETVHLTIHVSNFLCFLYTLSHKRKTNYPILKTWRQANYTFNI